MSIFRLRPLWLLAGGLLLPACQQKQSTEPLEQASVYEQLPPAEPQLDEAPPAPANAETYARLPENRFEDVRQTPLSTFAIDVDPASYSNVRRFLTQNRQLPPPEAVRVEELINYFHYDYPQPRSSDAPATLNAEVARCPWNPAHRLVLVGVQGREVATRALPPANLVFLLDVSGSMNDEDKLPLLKASLRQLVHTLRPQDYVSIVVYAGAAGLVLPPTPGSQPQQILAALDNLEAGGSTAGGEGLRLAYQVARQQARPGSNTRIILATDGDFNVGESSDEAMEQLVTQERQSGVFLSVLGFGEGNLQDSKMEVLADKGNGNYAYIDNLNEARRVLVQQFGGTLFTLAQDVKVQVEFNPAQVAQYRLIGYENRLLAAEDFNDDTKDAGELGAGQQVTALYEIVPANTRPAVDPLKYQSSPGVATDYGPVSAASAELLTVKLRYQEPQGSVSRLLKLPVRNSDTGVEQASDNLRLAAAVAEFGLLLRQSEHRGTASYAAAGQLAQSVRGRDADGSRREFAELVRQAGELSSEVAQALPEEQWSYR
ncbi:vWA domain-containing protein [Hymenobacter chitinivorans]|uniref:Ca-activated chloride channel family protein n=1 Tax=Hymenobacter chitinivorans DSM 11115 TaxID=1121954 RepID=A0A2M9B4G3_9BACT|nr:VWA domain-containing protein [Hymenobacter chitinivorans]PJJ52827.1 Ca-activated chloride channel family protein [Hymenobacter chitinivorans DSM 11115]